MADFDLKRLNPLKLTEKEIDELTYTLNRRRNDAARENYLKAIAENEKYVGICFKIKSKNELHQPCEKYGMVVRARSNNKYHLECLTFKIPFDFEDVEHFSMIMKPEDVFGTIDFSLFTVESLPLLCTSFKASEPLKSNGPAVVEPAGENAHRARIVLDDAEIITAAEFWSKAEEALKTLRTMTEEGHFNTSYNDRFFAAKKCDQDGVIHQD